MDSETYSKWKSAVEKGKPLLDSFLADLEREAALIKERDLDPRKLAEEPRVQEARSSAVEALEYLTEFARSLDGLVRTYAVELEKKVDFNAIKEQIASAPSTGRSYIEDVNGHDLADRLRSSGDDAKEKVTAATQKSKEQVSAAAQSQKENIESAAERSKEQVSAAAHKGKDSTTEMVAALGWAAAATAVIYVVFMDEKRRRQSKKLAKAAASGISGVANSATSKLS